MKKFRNVLAIVIAAVMTLVFAVSCTPVTDPDNQATDAPATSTAVPDADESTVVIAYAGTEPIYDSDFSYFLNRAIMEIYYKAEGVYAPDATDDENLAKMREFMRSTDEDGISNLQRAVDRTLEITQGFKIAYREGKALADQEGAKYTVDQAELEQALSYIDSEADYGAGMYGASRDEYFYYVYGMKVNDAKRYQKQQLYAELHEKYWSDENGYVIGMEEPEAPVEPTKPSDLADEASDEEKTKYAADIEEYNTLKAKYDEDLEKYNADLAKYNELKTAYFEKFREEYNENEKIYGVRTVRSLFLSKTDDDGEPLSEDAIAAKRAELEKYIELVKEGLSFAGLVKGFSEAQNATTNSGLIDICAYEGTTGDLPQEVIDRAFEINEVTDIPEIVETDDGFYLFRVEGIVNYDEQIGIVADSTTSNPDKIRSNVEYSKLASLYNEYVEGLMEKDEYKLKDIQNEAALKLVNDFIDFTMEGTGVGY